MRMKNQQSTTAERGMGCKVVILHFAANLEHRRLVRIHKQTFQCDLIVPVEHLNAYIKLLIQVFGWFPAVLLKFKALTV